MPRSAIDTQSWRKLRLRILARDDYTCRYCGGVADTVDHIVPRTAGGTEAPTNLAAACRKCNSRKGGSVDQAAARGTRIRSRTAGRAAPGRSRFPSPPVGPPCLTQEFIPESMRVETSYSVTSRASSNPIFLAPDDK